MRVATVDIGTNTVLLLVAEAKDGSLVPLAERMAITRLGQGVDRQRRFAPEAIARTLACLSDFARTVEHAKVDRIAVVGTSAVRDASGGADELRAHVRASFGVDIRVLDGREEAELTFRGAVSGLASPDATGEIAVFDIGGGSTEVIVGCKGQRAPTLSYAESFDVGSVRLTERHVIRDPPTSAERDALWQAAKGAFSGVPALPARVREHGPVGVAGTMTTLAAVSLALSDYDPARVHGHVLSRETLASLLDRLARLDVASKKRVPGLDPGRADVIVAGATIALALLVHWNAAAVVVSDRGLRWGLAEELAHS